MARRQRQRLCPEITDPELRGFLDMVPSIRRFQHQVLEAQTIKGEQMLIALEGREVQVFLHRARSAERPVVYELHGGGFVLGEARRDDAICSEICELADVNVIGVDYRLTPEFPYPAPLDDLCDLICYFAQNGQQYGIDGKSVGLIGFSGGATLAAAAAIRSAAGEIPALKGVVLHYPYLDSVHMPAEKEHFDCDMDPAVMSAFTKLYSREEERSLSLVSPVCATAEELKNFAPTMVIPAEKDALRKEGLLFADKLREAGAAVYCRVMPDVHHGYIEDAGNMEFFNSVTLEDTKKALNPYFTAWAEAAIRLSAEFLSRRFRGEEEL